MSSAIAITSAARAALARLGALLLALSLLGPLACAKGSGSTHAPPGYGERSEAAMAPPSPSLAYEEDGYGAADAESAKMARRSASREMGVYAESDAMAMDESMPPASPGAAPEPAPVPQPDEATRPDAPDPTSPDPQATHGRQIVYTASMRIAVFKLRESMEQIEPIPARYGGWIHVRRNDYLEMKIPAARLGEAMDALAKVGQVRDRQLQAQDVTAEYVDLESRIRVLERTQKQLMLLLEQAKTVEEALNVRKALDAVTMELEVNLGRMRQLKDMVSFSTLSVQLDEQAPHVLTRGENDPFPWVDSLGVEATEWN